MLTLLKRLLAFTALICIRHSVERHRSRIPINYLNQEIIKIISCLNTVRVRKKHLIQFLGLKELTIRYGLEDFEIDYGREK